MKERDVNLELFVAHRGALLSYANGIVDDPARAEDIVQEAFLRFRSATSSRLLEEPLSYLYRIVRNLAYDLRRHLSVEGRVVVEGMDEVAVEVAEAKPSPEAVAASREEFRNLLEAIAELPERTRIAMEMHRFGGFKLREIAAHLGISVSMAQLLVMEGVAHCQSRL